VLLGDSDMTNRLVALLRLFPVLFLMSCGGSTATPATSHSPNQSAWQVILTVKTTSVNLGIAGVALDGNGNLYLAEFDDSRIYKYSTSGNLLAQWGERGSGPGQLEGPDKLAFDAHGNLYVTEVGNKSTDGNSRIQKFSPTGMPLAQWGTFGSAPGQFNTPVGIAVDQQGDIYVAEEGGYRIQKLSSRGQPLTQWGTLGSGPGQFKVAYDLALDTSGNVYVSEPNAFGPANDRIQKFSPAGVPLAQWGEHGSGPGQFSNPTGLAVDSKGNVFVVDSGNCRIQELSSTGKYLAHWLGPEACFVFTSKIAVDDHGNMYVSIGSQVVKLVVR
jgi:tripartite motif-containing protein 71